MRHALAALSVLFLFDASPSADVVRYDCHAWHLRMVEIPVRPGCYPRCFVISPPLALACDVFPSEMGADFEARVADLSVGVVFGCVEAVDAAGNVSECIGWSDPPSP